MNEIYFKLAIKILEPCVNLFKVNPFLANVPILQPLKTPKTFGFLVFSGGIKWEHWPEMG